MCKYLKYTLGFIVNTLYCCSYLKKNYEQCTEGTVILLVLETFPVLLPTQARACHPTLTTLCLYQCLTIYHNRNLLFITDIS